MALTLRMLRGEQARLEYLIECKNKELAALRILMNAASFREKKPANLKRRQSKRIRGQWPHYESAAEYYKKKQVDERV